MRLARDLADLTDLAGLPLPSAPLHPDFGSMGVKVVWLSA
jgi:hypothetical protein